MKRTHIVVEGHSLSREAVEKAYEELQQPERPKEGDIVARTDFNTEKHYVVLGDTIAQVLGKHYRVGLQPREVRVTDGRGSFTLSVSELEVVGSLND